MALRVFGATCTPIAIVMMTVSRTRWLRLVYRTVQKATPSATAVAMVCMGPGATNTPIATVMMTVGRTRSPRRWCANQDTPGARAVVMVLKGLGVTNIRIAFAMQMEILTP